MIKEIQQQSLDIMDFIHDVLKQKMFCSKLNEISLHISEIWNIKNNSSARDM